MTLPKPKVRINQTAFLVTFADMNHVYVVPKQKAKSLDEAIGIAHSWRIEAMLLNFETKLVRRTPYHETNH